MAIKFKFDRNLVQTSDEKFIIDTGGWLGHGVSLFVHDGQLIAVVGNRGYVWVVCLYSLLREKCPNTDFFWSLFSSIWTEYGDLRSKSPYSVQMRENTDQKNSVLGRLSRRAYYLYKE